MAWLVRDGQVLASLEVADTRRSRRRGLRGRDAMSGALLLMPCRSIHTFGMRFGIDAAFVDADGSVREIVHVRRARVTRPRLRARSVIEAELGAFERWGLAVGEVVEVSTGD